MHHFAVVMIKDINITIYLICSFVNGDFVAADVLVNIGTCSIGMILFSWGCSALLPWLSLTAAGCDSLISPAV